MKCSVCKRNIAAGADAQKMIVEYAQPDGTTKIFGYMMADGPLTTATGQILRAWHHKHFHIQRKREQRGDAVTGRVLTGIPTGYEIGDLVLTREEAGALGFTEEQARERGTAHLSAQLQRLHEVAARIGKRVGDPYAHEAFWADQHHGPYPHTHHLRLETYQLLAHLHYAHGFDWVEVGAQGVHNELHAQETLAQAQAARLADPGHIDPPERDWRDQAVVDI